MQVLIFHYIIMAIWTCEQPGCKAQFDIDNHRQVSYHMRTQHQLEVICCCVLCSYVCPIRRYTDLKRHLSGTHRSEADGLFKYKFEPFSRGRREDRRRDDWKEKNFRKEEKKRERTKSSPRRSPAVRARLPEKKQKEDKELDKDFSFLSLPSPSSIRLSLSPPTPKRVCELNATSSPQRILQKSTSTPKVTARSQPAAALGAPPEREDPVSIPDRRVIILGERKKKDERKIEEDRKEDSVQQKKTSATEESPFDDLLPKSVHGPKESQQESATTTTNTTATEEDATLEVPVRVPEEEEVEVPEEEEVVEVPEEEEEVEVLKDNPIEEEKKKEDEVPKEDEPGRSDGDKEVISKAVQVPDIEQPGTYFLSLPGGVTFSFTPK